MQTGIFTDPDNVELAHLATQAMKKKAKLSMVNASGKQSVIFLPLHDFFRYQTILAILT